MTSTRAIMASMKRVASFIARLLRPARQPQTCAPRHLHRMGRATHCRELKTRSHRSRPVDESTSPPGPQDEIVFGGLVLPRCSDQPSPRIATNTRTWKVIG